MTISSVFSPQATDGLEGTPHQVLTRLVQKIAALQQVGRSHLNRVQPYLANLSLGVALVSIACASIFIVIAETELSPGATAFNRLLIAGLVFGVWQWRQATSQAAGEDETTASPGPAPIAGSTWSLLLLAGLSFAGSLTCAAWSLTQTSVANSTLLNNMMPIFTTLGAWLVLGKRFSQRFVLGLAVAIAGVSVIGAQDLQVAGDQLIGDGAALLAAVFLATTILSVEHLRTRFSTPAIMAGLSWIGAIALLPIALLSGGPLFPGTWSSSLAILGLAMISQVMGHGLLTYSLKQLSSGLVSVLMLAIPVISAILAMILFAQSVNLINGLAFLGVLGGIYLAISAPLSVNGTDTDGSGLSQN